MTGLLHDVLRERGDAAGAPQLDLGAIVAEGERRVRRSRVRTTLVAATAAVVVTVGVGTLPGLLDPPRRQDAVDSPAATPFGERRVSWANGSTVHWGEERYDVGVDVTSYVQTDDGFVLSDRDGTVHLFDGSGTRRIGSSTDRALRTDDSGSLVAWVSDDGGEGAQYVVYDTGSRREVARVGDDTTGTGVSADDGGPVVYAVDGDAAYWRTGEGIVRYDVVSGRTELLSSIQRTPENPEGLPRGVVDVADGTIAWNLTDLEGTRFFVGDRIGAGGRELPTGYNGTLSPDGSVAAVEEGDETRLYDTRTGEELPLDLPSHPYRFVYGWVDADTAMTFALQEPVAAPTTADVLLCDVRAGECRAAATVTLGRPESFVVPSGTPMT